jgi:hypothetical protein
MKETQPQVLESTSQWPQKILTLAPNLNRPLECKPYSLPKCTQPSPTRSSALFNEVQSHVALKNAIWGQSQSRGQVWKLKP